MLTSARHLVTVSLAALVLLPAAGHAQIVLQDGDFLNWSSTYYGATGSSAAMVIEANAGNPGAAIRVMTVSGSAALLMLNQDWVYDPSVQGVLSSVQLAYGTQSISAWGQGQGIHLALRQGGLDYLPSPSGYLTGSSTGWVWNSMVSFSELNFTEINGSGTPDFSAAGSPITFGFHVGNTNSGTYEQRYDNITISLDGLIDAPQLTVSNLIVGSTASFVVTSAIAGEQVYFAYSVAGLGAGPCFAALGGLCVDLLDPVGMLGRAQANNLGVATLGVAVPALAAGVTLHLQAAIPRGPGGVDSVLSQALTATVP